MGLVNSVTELPQRAVPAETPWRNHRGVFELLPRDHGKSLPRRSENRRNTRGKSFFVSENCASPTKIDILAAWQAERGEGDGCCWGCKHLNSVHRLFTSLPFPPCQRLEIRNRAKERQEKTGTLFFFAAEKNLDGKTPNMLSSEQEIAATLGS
jgi:hypothetical protein